MATDLDSLRIAEVYRLTLAGLTPEDIIRETGDRFIGLTVDQIESDRQMIARWEQEYQDPEKVRLGLALDLDSVFKSIMTEIQGTWVSKTANAKALFYREARETLMQKALLYGLNTQNVTVSQKNKLWTVIQDLRKDATQLETEADRLALPEPDALPAATDTLAGLLVESDSDYGR